MDHSYCKLVTGASLEKTTRSPAVAEIALKILIRWKQYINNVTWARCTA